MASLAMMGLDLCRGSLAFLSLCGQGRLPEGHIRAAHQKGQRPLNLQSRPFKRDLFKYNY